MRISSVSNIPVSLNVGFSAKSGKVESFDKLYTEMNGEVLVMEGRAGEYFEVVENLSNPKIGSKFIIESKLPQYRGLRMLITPDSSITSNDMYAGIRKKGDNPAFKGRLYGSIRESGSSRDSRMENEYIRFWMEGMHDAVVKDCKDNRYAPYINNDYNFYIPSDGDGTRYKDVTALQGGVTKPASEIPASMGGKPMSLVQGVITNFAKTGKLDNLFDFIRVEPAQGSAFGFLEGLKRKQIRTDKPLVFSWGDNLSDVNISRLMKNHEDSRSGFTISVLPVEKNKTKSLSIIKVSDIPSRKIDEFVEKPQDDDFIDSCVIPELGENMCLASVGPYILSPEALCLIKERYIQSPESFLSPDKGYDFSSMVITPMLRAFNNAEILDSEGRPLEMKFDIINSDETWSDLGSQKDLSQAMRDIKYGRYKYLPYEMKASLERNIDDAGNITFNEKSNVLFHQMLNEISASAHNIIAYCKD